MATATMQMELFEPEVLESVKEAPPHELLPLEEYDEIVVEFSGGKDSGAVFFDLLDRGVPVEKIRLWHQCVDGDPHAENPLLRMDWPCTTLYCDLFAERFGVSIEFQWRRGGIGGELFRINRQTNAVQYELNGEVITLPSAEHGQRSTRMRWPAQSANLASRWCSSTAKIDVASRAMASHPDFARKGIKVLVLTGERREESEARAKYAEKLPYRLNSGKRLVDQWRSVIDLTESEVWELWRKYDTLPHPAYLLGWSRCSCFGCIFNGPDHWAMMAHLSPELFEEKVQVEEYIQFTLDSKMTLRQKAAAGSLKRLPLNEPDFEKWKTWALTKDAMMLDDLNGFVMPVGAFGGAEGGAP